MTYALERDSVGNDLRRFFEEGRICEGFWCLQEHGIETQDRGTSVRWVKSASPYKRLESYIRFIFNGAKTHLIDLAASSLDRCRTKTLNNLAAAIAFRSALRQFMHPNSVA